MKRLLLIISLILTVFSASAQPRGHHKKGFDYRGHKTVQKHHPKHHGKHVKMIPLEVACVGDWQELWNGRHVRLMNGRVCIYEADGDRILWGDEIVLLSSGKYKVRSGDWWRLYDEDGDRFGTIWSHDFIDLLPNGCYLYRTNDWEYVADERGERIHSIWGDKVELMQNGLFRCHRNDRFYYYDARGNERN